MRTPCIKFVAETASFFTFLAMIVGNSFAERDKLCDSSLADNPESQVCIFHDSPQFIFGIQLSLQIT